jgi:hypothetical protein
MQRQHRRFSRPDAGDDDSQKPLQAGMEQRIINTRFRLPRIYRPPKSILTELIELELTWALASPADTSLASPPFHPSTRQGLICRPETVKDKCGGEESLDHGSSTNIGIEEETKSCLEELEDLGGEGMAEETSLGT